MLYHHIFLSSLAYEYAHVESRLKTHFKTNSNNDIFPHIVTKVIDYFYLFFSICSVSISTITLIRIFNSGKKSGYTFIVCLRNSTCLEELDDLKLKNYAHNRGLSFAHVGNFRKWFDVNPTKSNHYLIYGKVTLFSYSYTVCISANTMYLISSRYGLRVQLAGCVW